MFHITAWYIIPIAFMIDYILGDPHFLPHPIRWMGNTIGFMEIRFRKLPFKLTISGVFFSVFLITITWLIVLIVIKVTFTINSSIGTCVEIILIYYSISARSLDKAAVEVDNCLKNSSLDQAKRKLSLVVGRETRPLRKTGVINATIETVAENFVDGVVSPLFFAAIGGAPLAMAYKMVNTLDSMVGYKNEKYLYFGKASAKIDDVSNLRPARLSVPII